MQATTVTLPVRNVNKVKTGYVVEERQAKGWKPVSKVYAHSTSAYAALGRMTNKQTILEITK